jgi:hypothetical protein
VPLNLSGMQSLREKVPFKLGGVGRSDDQVIRPRSVGAIAWRAPDQQRSKTIGNDGL